MISKLIRLFLHFLPLQSAAYANQRHLLSMRNSMFSSSTGDATVLSGGAVAHLLTNSPEAHNSYGNFPIDDGTQRMALLRSNEQRPVDQQNSLIHASSSTSTIGGEMAPRHLTADDQLKSAADGDDSFEVYDESTKQIPPSTPIVREPAWLRSGKFQGDIDGVDEQSLRQLQNPAIQFNALRNRQLIWLKGVIPYELDLAFSLSEARLLQRVFRTYRRRTFGCIRFRPRRSDEPDYLNIVKGIGCYSQVGKTGGRQELSLGRGCLFNETITHELMHSLGFWHEHSRADREEHIIIRWENILPGMDSQFDIVSSAIQDTLGEPYDYRSIMHYGSSAFSRNGRNTLEAVVDEFTNIIGTSMELSEMDVAKIMKLYRCSKRREGGMGGVPSLPSAGVSRSIWRKRKMPSSVDRHQLDNHHHQTPPSSSSSTRLPSMPFVDVDEDGTETAAATQTGNNENAEFGVPRAVTLLTTTTQRSSTTTEKEERKSGEKLASRRRKWDRCRDHFLDCPQFRDYCKRISFYFIMRSYCPHTCGRCRADSERAGGGVKDEETTMEEEDDDDENEQRAQAAHSKRERR